ncbi:MAG TPA: BrnT family toxin [Planctomycetes bacterium]|jgi:hypothetical protein|nr:BrnT family toxin [Planctomycetota bacterium]
MRLEFEWGGRKARENVLRHGIDFVDATGVFFDPCSLEAFDDRGEYGEDRFRVIGMVQGRVLFVVYTERRGRIRLISARMANRKERMLYENARRG